MIVRKGDVNTITNKMCSVQASCMHRLIFLCLQKYLKEHLNYKSILGLVSVFFFFFPNSAEHKYLLLPCGCLVFVRRHVAVSMKSWAFRFKHLHSKIAVWLQALSLNMLWKLLLAVFWESTMIEKLVVLSDNYQLLSHSGQADVSF